MSSVFIKHGDHFKKCAVAILGCQAVTDFVSVNCLCLVVTVENRAFNYLKC